ncbi:type IV pilus assembly protein PilM [Vallicoccus soli]|uniref:Type IV pilus assembly protein PilM n=1 Tax=Vallicoccus soli TaxID=2339232 RepID=A0A3A3YYE8_9ACTN|nr:type IV pilus assembly protein PilM [Vallicoccus soli]RJK96770.1 type IV pilus assembly protein PilM [Vallicoccus soli]
MAVRSAVGLDIGTSSVRAAQLSFGGGSARLDRFGQLALPDGAVRDGEVADADAVGEAIKRLWSLTGFRSKRVHVGVANSKVIVRQVDLPWLPLHELRAALPFQVQDVLPMPVESALLDFHPLSESGSDEGRTVTGLLVAASREMVSGALEAVERGGLTPVAVDLSSFAVLRSLAEPDHLGLAAEAEALVDVGARVTNVVVHQGGVPRFVRILLAGGRDVTDAVADRIGLPHADAEALKHQVGSDAPIGGVEATTAVVVEGSTASFVDDIRGSLGYYASTGGAPVSRIVLTGGGSRLHGLAHRLGLATGLPVQTGAPFSRLTLGRTGLTAEQLAFVEPLAVVPVGLALGAAA